MADETNAAPAVTDAPTEAPKEEAPATPAEPKAEEAPAPAAEAPVAETPATPETPVAPATAPEEIRSGYKVRVAQKIVQGGKERIQNFEGIVIATSGKTPETKTITVRKVSEGIGVEKIFPLASPNVTAITVLDKMNVRRSKLYYLRNSLQKFQQLRRKK
ncbi:MAG: 50S ribosomal protein L19 [Candidatus Kerfeldbacteria bacterium]|nr:50S ribosomal protein L19 [Candidatus Kerfeldbacteria bacterium]